MRLQRIAASAYAPELASLASALQGGLILRAEVLRRWNDFVGADQVARFISSGSRLGRYLRTVLSLEGVSPDIVAGWDP